MTPKEKYIKALHDLIEAQKLIDAEQDNPFNFGLPTHMGLSDETFITDDELNDLSAVIGEATADNNKFSKLWNLGTDLIIKAKAIL